MQIKNSFIFYVFAFLYTPLAFAVNKSAYENFHYPLNEHSSLDQLNGGSGWYDAWSADPALEGCAAGAFVVSSTSDAGQHKMVQIGQEGWAFTGTDSFATCWNKGGLAKRTLSETYGDDEKEVWVSFWAYANHWFENNNTPHLKIGISFLHTEQPYQRYSSETEQFSVGSSAKNIPQGKWVVTQQLGNPSVESVAANSLQPHRFLIKIVRDGNSSMVFTWVDQPLSNTPPNESLASVMEIPAVTFNRIALVSNRKDGVPLFDDIVITDAFGSLLFPSTSPEQEPNDSIQTANAYVPGFRGLLTKMSDSECYVYFQQHPTEPLSFEPCLDKDYVSFTVPFNASNVNITSTVLTFMYPIGRTLTGLALYDTSGRLLPTTAIGFNGAPEKTGISAQLNPGTYVVKVQYFSDYSAAFHASYSLDISVR